MERKSWICFVCNSNVFEGQRIAFTKYGPAHWECWVSWIDKKLNYVAHNDVFLLMESEDFINVSIIKLKEYEQRAKDENVKKRLHELRKTLEIEGAKIEKLLEEKISA
ncbi:MAG: DUF2175 family protein [Thermoprotei archaeon]